METTKSKIVHHRFLKTKERFINLTKNTGWFTTNVGPKSGCRKVVVVKCSQNCLYCHTQHFV